MAVAAVRLLIICMHFMPLDATSNSHPSRQKSPPKGDKQHAIMEDVQEMAREISRIQEINRLLKYFQASASGPLSGDRPELSDNDQRHIAIRKGLTEYIEEIQDFLWSLLGPTSSPSSGHRQGPLSETIKTTEEMVHLLLSPQASTSSPPRGCRLMGLSEDGWNYSIMKEMIEIINKAKVVEFLLRLFPASAGNSPFDRKQEPWDKATGKKLIKLINGPPFGGQRVLLEKIMKKYPIELMKDVQENKIILLFLPQLLKSIAGGLSPTSDNGKSSQIIELILPLLESSARNKSLVSNDESNQVEKMILLLHKSSAADLSLATNDKFNRMKKILLPLFKLSAGDSPSKNNHKNDNVATRILRQIQEIDREASRRSDRPRK